MRVLVLGVGLVLGGGMILGGGGCAGCAPDREGDEPGTCEDGLDNDGDGATDCEDTDCAGSAACTRIPGDTADTGEGGANGDTADSATKPVDTADSGDSGQSGDTGESTGLVFALYDDTASAHPSAWAEGLDLIEESLVAGGIEVVRVTRTELNGQTGVLESFDGFVMGGGYADPGYTEYITAAGKTRIQEFVHGGGAFVGICAGAFIACSSVTWHGAHYDDGVGYDLDLYSGNCPGPIVAIADYPDWGIASLRFEAHEAFAEVQTGSFERDVLYAAGPYFETVPHGAEVLATYHDPELAEHGTGALVVEAYGQGRVVLWGPHPEAEEEGGYAVDSNQYLLAALAGWAAARP